MTFRLLGLSDEQRLELEQVTGIKSEGVQLLLDTSLKQAEELAQQMINTSIREVQEIVGPHGSLTRLQAGGINISPGMGISVFEDGVLKTSIKPDGNLLVGSNIEDPATTTLCAFVNDQVYNTEQMEAGDLLIGDNSESVSNVKYDASEGQLQFRYGTTVKAYMDTDGSIKAGEGFVTLDENGVTFLTTDNVGLKPFKFVDESGVVRGYIYYYDSVGVSTNFHLIAGATDLDLISSINLNALATSNNATAAYLKAQSGAESGHQSLMFVYNYSTTATAEMRVGKMPLAENKYFRMYIYVPDSGQAYIALNDIAHDIDTIIRGDTDQNLIYADASADKVGIGKNNPSYKLDVAGDINIDSGKIYRINGAQLEASNIPITDSGGYFTGTNTEAALQELGAGSGGGREILTANRTYYVRTDGSDSNDGLTDSAGGAFLTAAHANDIVATIDKSGYDITVQFGTGTWAEDIIINTGIGDGTVSWKGTLTLLESVTSATVAAGSGATAGTVTKTGQFTGNSYGGKLCYFVTDAVYCVVYSNTNDVLTLADIAPSSTTQNVEIYDWGTLIDSLETSKPDSPIILEHLKVSVNGTTNGYCVEIVPFTTLEIYRCYLGAVFVNQGSIKICEDTYFYVNTALANTNVAYSGTAVLTRCLLVAYHTSAFGAISSRGAYVLFFGGTIDGTDGAGGKATYGVRAWGAATAQINATGYGYLKCKNCDTGLRVDGVSAIYGSASVSFTSCTTNTSADAATYGVFP